MKIKVEFKNIKTRKHIIKYFDSKQTFIASKQEHSFYISDKDKELAINFSKKLTEKQLKSIDNLIYTFMDNELKTLVFISNDDNDTVNKIIYNNIEINI